MYLKFRRWGVFPLSPLLKRVCKVQVTCSNCWKLVFFLFFLFKFHYFLVTIEIFTVLLELSVEDWIVCQEHNYFHWVKIILTLKIQRLHLSYLHIESQMSKMNTLGAGESQLNLVCHKSCFSPSSLWSQKVQHSLRTSTVTYTTASKSLTVKLSICFVIWWMALICYFNCFLVRH